MTLDWWGLGLQAINVLILVWLLSRVFWRPVAGAITRRQDAAQALLDDGKTAQAKADAALAEVAATRAGIAAEREAVLAEAKAAADTNAKATISDAKTKAASLIAAAQITIDRDTDAARKETAAAASALSVEIAGKLLEQMKTPSVQATFLTLLIDAIAGLSGSNRKALAASEADIEIISATALGDADRKKTKKLICDALGGAVTVSFTTDPSLIAGLELRSGHFVLHNSWRADLENLLKEMKDAT